MSAVVVNWNCAEHVAGCLDSLRNQSHPDIQMVVVDNGSTDGSMEMIRDEYESVRLIENTSNVGYCRALNQGIDAVESEFVLCLNADVRLEPCYVQKAVDAMLRNPECGMFAGLILRFDGRTVDSAGQFVKRDRRPRDRGYGESDNGQYSSPGSAFSVCGAAGFYRREMLEDVALGGEYFDEDYFAFNEDLDISWRAQLRGWKCVYDPSAVAYHHRGGTAKASGIFGGKQLTRRPGSLKYHIVKNRYMTMVKNDSLESLLADMPVLIVFDALLWIYVALSSPTLLFKAPGMIRAILSSLAKREMIQSRRSVSFSSIRKRMY